MVVTKYCDLEDLFTVGIAREAVVDEVARTSVDKAILDASATMDSSFRQRYTLPFQEVNDRSLVRHCAAIAAWYLLPVIGVNPEGNGDGLFEKNWKAALAWLEGVKTNRETPDVIDSSSSPTPGESSMGGPRVRTGSGRGYSSRQTPRGPGYFVGD